MEKIKLEFSAQNSLNIFDSVNVVMTLDETGKNYTVGYDDRFSEIMNKISEKQKELPSLPKRVLDAFTENAINKILSKDEIPNESGKVVLDGYSYEITITIGSICKKYVADDVNIETYPLLRYLASWYRHQRKHHRWSLSL